jgi:hypothetical protein
MLKYRQGDVGIQLVDSLPEGLEFRPVKSVVLAEGEVTGHAHVLSCAQKLGGKTDGTMFPLEIADKDGTMYLRIAEPLPLTHQEHATIEIAPGTYKVAKQMEYHPEAPRQVMD